MRPRVSQGQVPTTLRPCNSHSHPTLQGLWPPLSILTHHLLLPQDLDTCWPSVGTSLFLWAFPVT